MIWDILDIVWLCAAKICGPRPERGGSRPGGKFMKKYRFVILALLVLLVGGLTVLLWEPLMGLVSDPMALRDYVSGAGAWGVLVFSALNILQVVLAVIPGGPFEVAAGYLFGVIPGTLLCDVTMTIGSVLVFLLVRRFGMELVELFVSPEKLESIPILHEKDKVQSILFLIFLIPGTPKDVVTYLAGLTNISLLSWVLICFAGRFPAILLTTLGGSALGNARYGIVAGVSVVFLVLYLVGMRWYRRWSAKSKKDKTPDSRQH